MANKKTASALNSCSFTSS